MKIITKNRRARFEYEILQTFEAGLVLQGTEVKSLREGKANMSESHCRINARLEAFIINLHISHYEFGNRTNHDPLRIRKLLLHKNEIKRLYGQIREKGLSLVPLMLYFQHGKIKAEIALVRGKKLHDKREQLKQKDTKRDLERQLKAYQ